MPRPFTELPHPHDPARVLAERFGGLPRPTPQFRRRAWLTFQRALDPLAPPRPLKLRRR